MGLIPVMFGRDGAETPRCSSSVQLTLATLLRGSPISILGRESVSNHVTDDTFSVVDDTQCYSNMTPSHIDMGPSHIGMTRSVVIITKCVVDDTLSHIEMTPSHIGIRKSVVIITKSVVGDTLSHIGMTRSVIGSGRSSSGIVNNFDGVFDEPCATGTAQGSGSMRGMHPAGDSRSVYQF